MEITPWFTRKFIRIEDNGLFAGILERLAGTPLRLAHKLQGLTPAILTQKLGDKWSVQEETGHLLDLESLWHQRFEDFQEGKAVLSEADLSNRRTFEAGHNERPIREILTKFTEARTQLMKLLAQFTAVELQQTALHPRMRTPMRPIDLAYFVAEHDDHHLATISKHLQIGS